MAALRSSSALKDYSSFSTPEKLKPGSVVVSIDQAYFRPTEVETLLGDSWLKRIPFEANME